MSILTEINSPILGPNYSKSVDETFKNINDNFKKITSVPFLQGIKGDSFESYKEQIFVNNRLTAWGTKLIKCIFEVECTIGMTFDDVQEKVENNDKYKSTIDNDGYPIRVCQDLLNSSIYTYVIRDDSGEIIEENLSQYYHFIDQRLKGKITDDNAAFEDASCFLGYNPEKDCFEKILSLPTIYYDAETKDWCWKIQGLETGISCKGIRGEHGADGPKFHTVRIRGTQSPSAFDVFYNPVDQYIDLNDSGDHVWKDIDEAFKSNVSNGDIAYGLIYDSNNDSQPVDVTMCKLYHNMSDIYAQYATSNMFNDLANVESIINFFKKIGSQNTTNTHGRGLFIPAGFSDGSPSGYHMMWNDDDGNLHIGNVESYQNTKLASENPKLYVNYTIANDMNIRGALTVGGSGSIGVSTLFGTTKTDNLVVGEPSSSGCTGETVLSGKTSIYGKIIFGDDEYGGNDGIEIINLAGKSTDIKVQEIGNDGYYTKGTLGVSGDISISGGVDISGSVGDITRVCIQNSDLSIVRTGDKTEHILNELPVGTIMMWPNMSTGPSDGTWHLCNGTKFPRNGYQKLYNVIYPTSEGSTFLWGLLPNLDSIDGAYYIIKVKYYDGSSVPFKEALWIEA